MLETAKRHPYPYTMSFFHSYNFFWHKGKGKNKIKFWASPKPGETKIRILIFGFNLIISSSLIKWIKTLSLFQIKWKLKKTEYIQIISSFSCSSFPPPPVGNLCLLLHSSGCGSLVLGSSLLHKTSHLYLQQGNNFGLEDIPFGAFFFKKTQVHQLREEGEGLTRGELVQTEAAICLLQLDSDTASKLDIPVPLPRMHLIL